MQQVRCDEDRDSDCVRDSVYDTIKRKRNFNCDFNDDPETRRPMETRTTTPITTVMVLLEEKLRQQVRQDKPLLVAIDGRCASGKSTLAKDLQKQLDCNVIHMDDFYLQPHQRTTKRMREPGGNVDYERFETEVLQPMLTGEAFSYRPYDAHAVCFLPEGIVSPKKVMIIEGSYACHPRLRRSYDLRIFLTVDRQEQLERIRKRNGEEREEMFERIWIPLEERYFWKAGVEKTCDISLDTTGLFEG